MSRIRAAVAALAIGWMAGSCPADLIRVPEDFPTIQQAIDAAKNGDEILVAEGTYNEAIDFIGKAIFVHSEDGPEATVIDATTKDGFAISVATFLKGEGPESVLAGFTLTGGTGRFVNKTETAGGGIFISGASPTIVDCRVTSNGANFGGGVFVTGGTPLFIACRIHENFAADEGGGFYATNDSAEPTLLQCAFVLNDAGSHGGALVNDGGTVTLRECLFTDNTCGSADGNFGNGGAINSQGGTLTARDSRFLDNAAGSRGGGSFLSFGRQQYVNCLFNGNSADNDGGGLYNSSGDLAVLNSTVYDNFSFLRNGGIGGGGKAIIDVRNSIAWSNQPDDQIVAFASVEYSDVQFGFPGTGNIDLDPALVNPDLGDFRPSSTSPCIDAADNTAVPAGVDSDLDGLARFVDDPDTPDTGFGDPPLVDMGCFEFQVEDGTTDISFDPPREFLAAGEPSIEAVGDFDNDGAPDVVVLIPDLNPQNPGRFQVFLNRGNADAGEWLGFQGQAPGGTGNDPTGVAVGLFDADNIEDMAVANGEDDTVSIYFGVGDGNFVFQTDVNVGDRPSSITAGDFTEDGIIDLAVCHENSNDVWILQNDGNGNFAVIGQLGTGGNAPGRVQGQDIDNDKCLDIIGINNQRSADAGPVVGSVFVIRNAGGGNFDPAETYDIGFNPRDVSAGDFDLDGFADITAVNADDATASILINQQDGTYVVDATVDVGADPQSVDAIDLDGDLDADLAVVAVDGSIGPAVQVLENRGSGFTPPRGFEVRANPNFVANGDFNQDARSDLVTVNEDNGPSGGSVTVLLNAGAFTVTPESFSFLGVLLGGDLEDLFYSDDSSIMIEQRPAPLAQLPVIRLEVEGRANEDVQQFRVTLEAAATALPAAPPQRVLLYNFDTGEWDLVDQRQATRQDSVVEINLDSPSAESYVEPGTTLMRLRADWLDAANVIMPAWHARIDQATWRVKR